MKYLITGGTVFASKFIATYFTEKGHEIFVLNRGTRKQVDNVTLINADRNMLNECLDGMSFDAIIDVCAYNENDIKNLLAQNIKFDQYIFISSSAVYPETLSQPFNEKQPVGENNIWGSYGTNKIAAEKELLSQVPKAYILRPPYLYGPMQNVYRESFIFECAEQKRKFYIPKYGKMKLHFFHIEDLCRVIEKILIVKPQKRIINVGNSEIVNINTFVEICYKVVGEPLERIYVTEHENQRDYFPFNDYEYILDIKLMNALLPDQKNLYLGLKESYEWYRNNKNDTIKKPLIDYIDNYLSN